MDSRGHEVSHLSPWQTSAARLLHALTAKDEPELAAAEVVLLTSPYFVNTGVSAHNNSSREACAHGHADTGKQAECNKSGGAGRLLSEFLVQLIFVCEAGGGRNCSHDE